MENNKFEGMVDDVTTVFTEESLSQMGGQVKEGAFYQTLKANSKEIKESRAAALASQLEYSARNEILQLKNKLMMLHTQRTEMLDTFQPTSTTSLKIGEGFNGDKFIREYNNLGVEIRNTSVELRIALESYKYLLGKDFVG